MWNVGESPREQVTVKLRMTEISQIHADILQTNTFA